MNQIYKLLILGTLSLFLCTNNANSQTVTISSNPTTHNICLGASRTLTAAITGGTAPYTYNWSTGQSGTASIVVAPNTTTTYNVTITDNALPPVSATSNVITITVNPIPDMTVSNDTTVCSGQSVTLTANGATITNYFWIAPSFTPGANITFAPTTTTVASIIGSDGTCSNQKNITVNVNPLPTATISGATSVCQNDPSPSITFTGANGTSPYTFTYNINGGSNTTVVSVGNTATVSVPTGTAGTFVYNLVSVQDNSSTTCSQNQPQSATVTVNPLPTLVVNDPAEVCSPSTVNLTLPAVTAGSTSGLTLTYWTDASATIAYGTPTAATAGTYYIKGTTAAGCIDIQPVVVVVNQQPTITPLVDQAICLGASYAVDATVANGTPGYTYLWTPNTNITPNNTQEDVTLSPVVSNTYTLSVTDSKGCTATDNIAITVNNPPTADAGSPASICQGASTQLDASGSLQAISYLWSANPADASLTGLNNTSATPNVSPVVTTTYTVTVTNACGFNTDNVVVTIYPSVSISLGADKEICNGSSYTIPGNVTGGTSPFGYNWNPILNLSATNIPNPIAAPTTSTTYIVTVTDAHGCSNTDNIAITVNPKPDINAGADGSFCTGGSYPINATITTPGTPGYTYTWLPNNSTLDDISIEDPTANPAITTTYTVTVTDAKGCTDSDNIIVSVNANPIAEAGANTEICENSSHTLSGSASSGTPAYTYTWNDAGAQSHSVTPGVGSTVYTLTVSDSKGCTDSDNVTITVNPLPTADAGAAQTICGGTAASLDGTPGAGTLPYSFLWTATPATTITPNNIEDPSSSPAATTTYTIQVSDAKGCSATDNVIVTVDPAPVITVTGNDPNPCGTLTGDATANVPGLSTDYTYLWNTTATTQTISGLIAGIYSVTVTEIATGCSSIGSVSLSDPAPFAMTLASNDADNTICAGDNITFTATATPANATGYEFYVDGASAQNGPSNTFTPAPVLTNGQIVSVRGYDGTCSAFSSSITITVNPTPNADAGGDKTICSGNSTTLTASGGGTYVWSHLAGATASVTVNPTTETSYTVSVTLNGCVDTDEAIVFVNDKPAVSAGAPQSICAGESANLSASGATSYEWSNGANTQNTTVTPAATATYTVTGTDGNVCSNTSSVIITVNPVPTVVIINPAAVCSPNTVDLTDAAITAGSTPGLTYSYYTDAGATTPYLTPTVATAGTYYIKGETGVFCSDIQMVTVTVNPLPTANAGADQTICEGISTVLGDAPTASGGSAPYSYNWNPATTGGSNPTATPASTITYQLTVTDNNTCTAISDIQVTVIPAPIANAGGNQTICEGSDYLLTNATATNDASISWSSAGDGTFDDNTLEKPTYSPGTNDIAIGSVQLSMTITGNAPCLTDNDFMILTIDPMPTANAGGSQTICSNQTATVSGATSSNGSIAWTEDGAGSITAGATTLTPTYTAAIGDAGNTVTLTMTVTSANSACSVTASYTVIVDPIPTATAGGSQTICANETATVSGANSTNGTIAWTHDGAGNITNGTTLTPTYTPDATDAGNTVTLTMTVTSNNGGCAVTATYTILVDPIPTAMAGGSQTICANGAATLNPGDASSTNGTIAWTHDGAGNLTNETTLTPTYTADATDAGNNVTLTMTVTSNNGGCTVNATYTLTVDPIPTATAGGSQTICADETATVSGANSTNGTIAWTHDGAGNITNGTTLTPTYTPDATDAGNTVTLTMTVTSNNGGCAVDATYTILVDPIPTAMAGGSQTICANGAATLNPGDASSTNGTIAWTHDGAGTLTNETTLTPTYTADATDAGNNVTLTMTVTSNNGGCTVNATYTVTVDPIPTATAGGSQTICANETATVSGANSTNGTIAWTHDGAGNITNGTTLTPTYTPDATDAGNTVTLTMTVTSNNGGCAVTATYTILVDPIPTAMAGGSQTICANGAATLNPGDASSTNGTIAWTHDGAGTLTNETTLTPTYTADATDAGNNVTLTMTVTSNNGGCTVNATYTVTVEPLPTATAGGSSTICSNGVVTLNPGDATATNGTIAWTEDGAGSITAGATTLTPTYTADVTDEGKTVTLTMTVTSNNACGIAIATATYTIIVDTLPTATAGGTTTICSNGTATVNGATATNGTIAWTEDGAGSITSGATTLTPTYTAAAGDAGNTVTLTMTVTSDNAGCSVNATYSITVDPIPTAIAGGSTTICSNSFATLNPGDASATNGSILWTHDGAGSITAGATTLTPTYTADAADAGNIVTLTMTVTSNNGGCTATATYAITVNTLPTAIAGGSTTICSNGTATLNPGDATASNGTIAWTEDGAGSITAGATTLTPTYTAAAGDEGNTVTLTMTVTSNNSCGAATATATYTVIVEGLPTATAGGSTTICSNSTATVSGATATNGTIAWTEDGAGTITAGATTLTPTYTAAAGDEGNTVTLTMTVTSNNSCGAATATATYTITVDPIPTATAGGSTTICSNGAATLNPGDATAANGTISWTENGAGSITAGATTLTPTYTAAAGDAGNTVTLTMTVTSNNTCGSATATATYSVIVENLPTASAGGSTTICANATATVSGATATNGTISWTEDGAGSITAGATTLTPTYTAAAGDAGNTVTLTMTVTSNNSCGAATATANYTVIVDAVPTANAGGSTTICSNTTATVSGATATNGTIAWTENGAGSITAGATTLTPTYTAAAGDAGNTVTLTMTVTSTNSACTATATYSVIVDPLPTANAGGSSTICADATTTVSGATATNGTIAWTEDGAGSITAGATTLTPTYTAAAGDAGNTVTLTMTVTSNNTCGAATATATYTVIIDAVPTANAGGSTTICSNTTATVSGATATNGTIAWTENGAGSITAGANTLTPTYTAAAGDEGNNVTLTMIVTSANAACTATATYTVTVEGLPTATAGGSTTICSNGTTTLNPGDATSTNGIIAWTENGAGSITAGSNTLTPTYTAAAGDEGNTVTLTMTVTSNNTCGAATATATYTVLVNALPTALAGGSTTICVNGSATLNNGDASATNGTIAWTENGGGSITAGANTLTPTYTSDISDAGNTVTLTMTVTSNNACAPQTATASYSILVLPTPTANAGSDVTLCAGTAYTVVGASATNNSSVLWIATGGTGVLTNANTISPTYTPAVGDVNVTLELTSNGNTPCGNTNDQMTISYVSSPTANAGPDLTICANELATLVGTATNFTSVQWTGGAGIFSNSIATTTDYVPNATDPANLTITFTVTGSGACPVAADQMILTINPTPTANAGTDQTICPGTNANLNGTGAGVNGTYTWAGANLSATNIANPIANPTVTNSYTLTVIDANGCSDVDDMIVNTYNVVKPIITPDGPLTYCTAQPINLTLDAGAGFAAYQWKNNAANIIGQIAQTTLVTTIGNYSVQVQDGNGCFTESDIITVQISDPQPVLLADGATTFCENEDVILYFDDPYYTYIWSSGSTTSTIKATESGNYHATITDLYGCVAFSDSLLVTVNPIPDSYFGFADSLLKVDFYNFCNYTTGASNFTWNFGDGTPSINGISPTHNYANPGTYTVTLIATNACGADTFSMDITVVSSTDITENSNIASWNVYPNPTDNQVTIDIQSQIEQDLTIVIRNTIGQSVLSENQHINSNINRTQFDVSNLKQGIYLIEVITNKGMLSKKLLIQR